MARHKFSIIFALDCDALSGYGNDNRLNRIHVWAAGDTLPPNDFVAGFENSGLQ
jgi:hypothetical protein